MTEEVAPVLEELMSTTSIFAWEIQQVRAKAHWAVLGYRSDLDK